MCKQVWDYYGMTSRLLSQTVYFLHLYSITISLSSKLKTIGLLKVHTQYGIWLNATGNQWVKSAFKDSFRNHIWWPLFLYSLIAWYRFWKESSSTIRLSLSLGGISISSNCLFSCSILPRSFYSSSLDFFASFSKNDMIWSFWEHIQHICRGCCSPHAFAERIFIQSLNADLAK